MPLSTNGVFATLINFLGLLAAQTATTVDDQVVALLKAIHEDPALTKWFEGKVTESRTGPGTLSMTAEPPPEIAEAIKLREIPWAKLIEYLPTLITLFRTFSGT